MSFAASHLIRVAGDRITSRKNDNPERKRVVNLSLLLRTASVVLLATGAWVVLEGSAVSAAENEKKLLPFADCVKACIHGMDMAKAECAARQTPVHNYDVNQCVLSTETEVVECVRACNPSAQ